NAPNRYRPIGRIWTRSRTGFEDELVRVHVPGAGRDLALRDRVGMREARLADDLRLQASRVVGAHDGHRPRGEDEVEERLVSCPLADLRLRASLPDRLAEDSDP